jgi:hypothetical protein
MVISACGSQANATTTIDMPALQTVAYQTSIAGVKRTATADALTAMPKTTSTPIPLPTATVIPTTTALILGGGDVFYNGVSFTFDPVMGAEVFVSVALEPPVYTEFAFALGGDCRKVGCVTVYQVEAFRDYPFGDDIVDELQAAIETGSFSYFPTWGSAILLRAQTQHIRFQNGAGIRATVMRAQMGYFANNQELVYDFHGLTDDGQYYVEVIFPIDAPILLSSYDPVENTNEAALPVPALPDDDPFGLVLNDVMREYNQEAQRQLDLLESASFIPDLGYLDALVDSLLALSASGE